MPGIGKTLTCDECGYGAEVRDGVTDSLISLKPAICATCRALVTAIDEGHGPGRCHRCPDCNGTDLEFVPVTHDPDDQIGPAPCPRCDGTMAEDSDGMRRILLWD